MRHFVGIEEPNPSLLEHFCADTTLSHAFTQAEYRVACFKSQNGWDAGFLWEPTPMGLPSCDSWNCRPRWHCLPGIKPDRILNLMTKHELLNWVETARTGAPVHKACSQASVVPTRRPRIP